MPKVLVYDRLSPAQHMMLHVRWKQWQRKCSDDSETANWLNTNTKPCPKCQNQVEKNGGCNLVVCRCGQVQLFLESDIGFPTSTEASLCVCPTSMLLRLMLCRTQGQPLSASAIAMQGSASMLSQYYMSLSRPIAETSVAFNVMASRLSIGTAWLLL